MAAMRRIALLLALAAALVTAAVAQAATSSAPRGRLTKVEYRDFVALQRAEKQRPTSRNLTVIARHTCRSLTNVSRLLTTQHAECEASVVYSVEFAAFPYAVEDCDKLTTTAQQARCELPAVRTFEASVRAFISTNAASIRAATPRHLPRRCLAYLLFTKPQARATRRLWAGLRRYASALKAGNAGSIATANTRLDADLVSSKQAMS